MKKNKNNGFASEEQYEAVTNIVMKAIGKYISTVMVEFKPNSVGGNIIVTVETATAEHIASYFIDKDGLFYVQLEGNMCSEECEIFKALSEKAKAMFQMLKYKEA